MKIAVKLFAIVTVAFGLNEATKPEQHIDYSEDLQHSEETILKAKKELKAITEINDSLINKYFPIEKNTTNISR